MHTSLRRRRVILPLSLLALSACHPMACCVPADFPKDAPLVLKAEGDALGAPVDVVYDDLGIPHIYGETEGDLAYALGFMHGRDRQFQIFVFAHAAEGRLTELLGEDLLPIDRDNRLLTYNLAKQEAAMSDRDRTLVESYAQGLNQGARYTGRSAEMQILGVDWEDLDVENILAIMRLQQWSQSVGLSEEMSRHRLKKAVSPALFDLLWQDTPSRGVPIVDAAAHTGADFSGGADTPRTSYHQAPSSSSLATEAAQRSSSSSASSSAERRAMVNDALKGVREAFGARYGENLASGLSNSWAVDGAHTDSGAPIVCNDPHLGHSAPGVFYMVHLELPDASVVGGTFPGLPAVLIGHGRHIAWGITNAFADIQDVIVLRTIDRDQRIYQVDDTPMHLTEKVQRFRLGKEAGAEVVEEVFQESIYGPVLPKGYGEGTARETPWVDDDERLVLQWTASHFIEESSELMSSFWDLARAKTVDQAHDALQRFASPAMNVAFAIAENDEGPAGIHYRLNGIVPIRGDEQRVDVPRLGRTRQSGMIGVLPADQKPQLDNPEKGYLVASNQRIVETGALSQRFVGYEGIRPWRAARIHERLEAMLDGGTASRDEICSIQQDVTNIEARELAPILGAHCPDSVAGFSDDVVDAFCDAVADFDGVYSLESQAIPFARLMNRVTVQTLRRHMNDDLVDDVIGQSYVQLVLHEAIRSEDTRSILFDDPRTDRVEDLDDIVAAATKDALEVMVAEVGQNPDDWAWQRQHTLSFRGILASAPVVGAFFVTAAHPESGTANAPRAEAADPNNQLKCSFGAGLRLHAEMTNTPEIGMIGDIGNSGHFGHRHLEDQYPLWTKGETRVLLRDHDDVKADNDGLLRLEPR